MRQFTLALLLCSALLAGVGYVVYNLLWPQHWSPALPYAQAVVALVTWLTHHFLLKALGQRRQRDFNNLFMLVTSAKLMFYLFGIVVYVVLQSEQARGFLLGFLGLYFTYSALEIGLLVAQIKRFRAKAN